MLDEKDMTVAPVPFALRAEDGTLRGDFVERVEAAVNAADKEAVLALVGDLHEADAGAV